VDLPAKPLGTCLRSSLLCLYLCPHHSPSPFPWHHRRLKGDSRHRCSCRLITWLKYQSLWIMIPGGICICIYIYVCMYVCMYACMYVCMYIMYIPRVLSSDDWGVGTVSFWCIFFCWLGVSFSLKNWAKSWTESFCRECVNSWWMTWDFVVPYMCIIIKCIIIYIIVCMYIYIYMYVYNIHIISPPMKL